MSGFPRDIHTPHAPRRLGLVAVALILFLAALTLPSWGLASSTRSGGDIAVAPTDRVSGDLYVAARSLDVAGAVDGDLTVGASRVTIGGVIGGTAIVSAGNVEISGTIEGSLRVMGGNVRITGRVNGDIAMLGGRLDLPGAGQVGGSLFLAGGEARIDGMVSGDIRGWIGDLTVGGIVQGKVDVRTGSFNIHDSARLSGPVIYASRTAANVHGGAKLGQGITRASLDPWGGGSDVFSRASGGLLRTLWGMITGVLLIALTPRLADALGTNARRLIPALPLGLITLVLAPLLATVLLATVIGIPAGLIALALYFLALYLTQVIVSMAIGRYILPNRWNDGSRGFHLLAMTIGMIFLGVLRFIPLPYIHGLIMLVVTVWGLGAVTMLILSLRVRSELAPES